MRNVDPDSANLEVATARQSREAQWASENHHVIGTTFQIVGETLVEAADVRAGERVLDVAAGSGSATLAASRRYAHVTSTELVPSMLEVARERARAEALAVTFRAADAEDLPFADASFDVVLSLFGAMCVPEPATTAREMRRVLRPDGRIGLASWTPGGFVGRIFRVLASHGPPKAPLRVPTRGGTRADLARIFDVPQACIRCRRRRFAFRYRSAAHWVQVFRDFDGPVHKAFERLNLAQQQALERELTTLLEAANTAGPGSLVVPAEYLEAVIRPTRLELALALAQPH